MKHAILRTCISGDTEAGFPDLGYRRVSLTVNSINTICFPLAGKCTVCQSLITNITGS